MWSVNKTGHVSSLLALLATVGYGIVQVLQIIKVLVYPLDEILIYSFSLGIAVPFVVMVVSFHHTLYNSRKLWSHIAMLMAAIYAVFALLVYTVQLTVVLPYSETDANTAVLKIYPHSLFWTIDALAYITMGLTAVFLAASIKGIKHARSLRRMLLAHGLITVPVMFVYFYPGFSTGLLMIGSPWLVTACGSFVLSAAYFRKRMNAVIDNN